MNFVKNYSLTRNEYFKFNLRNIKRQSILYSILAAVLAFLLALFKKDMDTSVLSKIDFWLVYLLFVVIGVAIVNLYMMTMVFLGAKLVYKNNKKAYENLTFYFDEEGISQGDETRRILTKWSSFTSCYKSLGLYCFLISERQGIIVPKRIFNEEEQTWIESKIDKK